MTNGDYIRSIISDEFIAEHFFCRAICPDLDCDGCPLDGAENCFDHNLRMKFLRENREEVTTFSEEKYGKIEVKSEKT